METGRGRAVPINILENNNNDIICHSIVHLFIRSSIIRCHAYRYKRALPLSIPVFRCKRSARSVYMCVARGVPSSVSIITDAVVVVGRGVYLPWFIAMVTVIIGGTCCHRLCVASGAPCRQCRAFRCHFDEFSRCCLMLLVMFVSTGSNISNAGSDWLTVV